MDVHLLPRRQSPAADVPAAPPAAVRPHRHAGDLVRVGLGLAVLGIGFLIARRGEISLVERDLFRLVNDLPTLLMPVVWLVMQLGNVVAVPTLAAVAVLARRFRLARDLAVSGALAYLVADLVKGIVQRERPIGLPVGDVLNEQVTGLGFISGHSAVAAALATAAAPHLSRRSRRGVWALAWTVGLARIHVGAHLPLDVLGGLAAGWAIGSLVHWLFGVPRWEPPVDRVAALLSRFGLPVDDLRTAGVRAMSSHPLTGRTEGRPVFVKVLDPDRYERDWLYRVARWVAVRDVKDADALAPLGQRAEHEAVAALTARQRGVHVPAVLLARGDDRGAVVVQELLPGRPLDELSPAELTPELLRRVWEQVALLHRARIAHHDLVAASVLVDPDGQPWLLDFGNAQVGADADALAGDVAELLASLAGSTDVGVLVPAAVSALGADAVAGALPGLTPLSLSAATRTQLRRRGTGLTELRARVRAELGLPDPDRPGALRVGAPARSAAVGAAIVVFAGLIAIAGPTGVFESVERGGWRWLGGALAFALLGRAAVAAAVLVSVERRIALGRAFGATMSTDCASVLRGRPGGRQVAARFLEDAGVLPPTAERATVRTAQGAVFGAVLVAGTALVLGLIEGRLSDWRAPESSVPVALVGAGALLLVVLGQLLTRHDHQPAPGPRLLRRGAPHPLGTATHAVRWIALTGWSAAGIALEGAALAAALHAVGADVPLLASTTVYALLRLLWVLVPELSLPGAGEVLLLLALTALGAPLPGACAAVLLYRLLTFWLPVGGGALLISARRHGPR
ncbi:phosphatase PAP2 family protein [Modestobacter sp. VKM Ac-2978]|uniref:phosphatase PAP2 family protein n=1 Tax=Modestobacter sp. VKM Ac-2978 TaxID=3004132 RepID=UPI0022AA347D|nr:phosphatase PAP2 family protein [Modestobacter sp. VKM Ac-2978]MCZ2849775.1 lysylphosphatidylglycerol synthase domain-containing protein [Modestobacter sp. VKM Ac-2978]